MRHLAFSTTKSWYCATLLGLALALPACSRDDSMGSAINHDAALCSKYPVTSRTDGDGTTWWWWYFHWDTVASLPGLCASYGQGAKMIVEVGVPANPSPTTGLPECTNDEIQNGGTRACAMAGSYRFEAECTAGGLLLELPSQYAFHGYYHIESTAVPAAPRNLIMQDVHCSRDLYVAGGPAMGPLVADAGTDTADAPPPDAPPVEATPATCSQYPATSRTDANGVTWWWWYFHWNTVGDLGAFCASFGEKATMVIEVDYPQNPTPNVSMPSCTTDEVRNGTTRSCVIDKAYLREVSCLTGSLLIELPSENTFHGYYHMGSSVVPTISRHLVNQDVHCSRDLYITAPPWGPVDAGVAQPDVAPDGGIDATVAEAGPVVDGGCTIDTTGLPGSYDECVAAGGQIVPATSTAAEFCRMAYLPLTDDYARCEAGHGVLYAWDYVCGTRLYGGSACFIAYPKDSCPTTVGAAVPLSTSCPS